MAESNSSATAASQSAPSSAGPASQRLMSLDALRGFDMFWIIGAGSIVYALNRIANSGEVHSKIIEFLADQLEHAEWEGFHFYDLIFPLFVFMMGASIVFSLSKSIQQGGRAEAVKRVFRRFVLLFIVALIYSGGVSNPWPDIRLMGVLNRIALAYFFGGLFFIFLPWRALIGVTAALLLGYWAIMAFIPIRDIRLAEYSDKHHTYQPNDVLELEKTTGIKDPVALYNAATNRVTGKYDKGYNVANHFDFEHLPGKKWDVYWDPEGIVSTIPAIATCLLGIFAGLFLRRPNFCDHRKVGYLIGFGIASVVLGFLWGTQFPVVKKIWTSSYVLVAGGYSAILLGTFYLIVDVLKFRKWCQPFVWMGMNSITIYLASNFLGGFAKVARRLVGGDVATFFDGSIGKGYGDLVVSIVGLSLAFWFVHFLYRRKIFLRL